MTPSWWPGFGAFGLTLRAFADPQWSPVMDAPIVRAAHGTCYPGSWEPRSPQMGGLSCLCARRGFFSLAAMREVGRGGVGLTRPRPLDTAAHATARQPGSSLYYWELARQPSAPSGG